MATKKISELEAINAAEDNDVLVIVDTSESTTNKITKGNLLIGAGHTIEMTLNENYQIVLVLKNAAGTALSTQTIDLPNENAVTNLAYNNGILTVTKQSGATSQINLMGLIEGLVTESDFNTFKEALQTTLEAINEKDAEQDEAIAENYKVINKLNEKLENQQKVIDQLPQVTGQGTSITLENTIEAPFTKFDVEGNSEQETTTGKNLLPYPYTAETKTMNGVTFKVNEDGTVIANGTATANSYFLLKGTIALNGTYTISTGLGVSESTYMALLDENDRWIDKLTTKVANKVTATVNSNFQAYIYVSQGVTANNIVFKPMIRLSTITDDTYEKYTGGQATPNPNYEQPILSSGDNENIIDIQTIVKGRLDNGEIGYADNVENLTLNKDSFSFTTNANYRGVTSDFIKISKDFIVSYDNLNTEFVATVACYDKNKVWLGNATITGADDQKYRQYAIVNNTAYVRVYFYLVTAGTITVKKPKLEKGNKATPYSPYGMGSINEKIQTRNVVPNNAISQIKNGVELIKNEDGSFTLNGTASANFDITFATNFTLKAGVYTSSIKQQIKNGLYYSFDNIADTMLNGNSGRRKTTFTLNADKTYSRAFLWIDNGTTFNNETYFIQTEPGSTESSYVPHEEQDYSIFVQQPFRSNKDKTIKDKFVVKSDGKLYERHYIGRYIFTGNETFTNTGTNRFNADNLISYIKTENLINYASNYYKAYKTTASNGEFDNLVVNEESAFNLSLATFTIRFKDTRFSTIQELQSWLAEKYASGNPVYVDYLLAEPLDLPCTETQIQQIENKPSTYKDFTTINSEDETPAYLEVSGIRDIDTMFDKVTNAIVSLGGNV